MSLNQNIDNELKEAFVALVMALEPESLYQDCERTQEEADAAKDEIETVWKHLEKVHQVEVSQEEAEKWAWDNY